MKNQCNWLEGDWKVITVHLASGTILLKNTKGKWQNNIQILIEIITFAYLPKDHYHILNMKYTVR